MRNERSFPMGLATNDKRAAILDAALTLFAERGFHGTSVPDIATLARVGAGTIYRYFSGKEALVNALYQSQRQALGQALLTDFDAAAPPRVAFHQAWHRAIAFARNDPRAFQFLELHHHAPYLDPKSRALEDELLAAADTFVTAATARQIFKDVPARVLLAIVRGAFRGLVQEGCEKRLVLTDTVISQAEECLWEAIRR